MGFVVLGRIEDVESIAVGKGIRDRARLCRAYGQGRWRKRKGIALVHLTETEEIFVAEIHWYEAAGLGRKELKIKRRLE